MAITSFKGKHHFLSNFYPCEVPFEGLVYPTAEHAYQAMKTLKQSMREMISRLQTPGEAKRTGRKLEKRSNWDAIKLEIMEKIVWEKFSRHPDLAKLLLGTGNDELMEGNDWGDQFWGVDSKTLEGENHLGKILVKTRERIRSR